MCSTTSSGRAEHFELAAGGDLPGPIIRRVPACERGLAASSQSAPGAGSSLARSFRPSDRSSRRMGCVQMMPWRLRSLTSRRAIAGHVPRDRPRSCETDARGNSRYGRRCWENARKQPLAAAEEWWQQPQAPRLHQAPAVSGLKHPRLFCTTTPADAIAQSFEFPPGHGYM